MSFRLGGTDGVSVEAAKWAGALHELGFDTVTVAGEGPVDHLVPSLAMRSAHTPSLHEVNGLFDQVDLVVVENLCSLPLNPEATRVVAEALAGRRAIVHHHDLAWQRADLAHMGPPPTDPAWIHVTINELSRGQLAQRGIRAVTIYNCFDTGSVPGDRATARSLLGIAEDETVLLQPTRAIPRKNIPAALRLAESLGALYWLTGPAEDGYEAELDRLLAGATTAVLRDGSVSLPDAYAACDAVAFPSVWEGFGNPALESALHRRPLAIGRYPVADELAAFGFRWFPCDDPGPLASWLEAPDPALLEHNRALVERHFALQQLPGRIERAMLDAGWH